MDPLQLGLGKRVSRSAAIIGTKGRTLRGARIKRGVSRRRPPANQERTCCPNCRGSARKHRSFGTGARGYAVSDPLQTTSERSISATSTSISLMAGLMGNPIHAQAPKRVVIPLFAFVCYSSEGTRTGEDQWVRGLERHGRILGALRSLDPVFAERSISQSASAFVKETQNVLFCSRVLIWIIAAYNLRSQELQ
jgi:hypothetical protein